MRREMLAIATATLLTLPAIAQERQAEVLAGPCMTCHGLDGRSHGAIPALAGNDANQMATMMKAFASGAARGTVMNYIAKGYTSEQIDAVAAFFASRKR